MGYMMFVCQQIIEEYEKNHPSTDTQAFMHQINVNMNRYLDNLTGYVCNECYQEHKDWAGIGDSKKYAEMHNNKANQDASKEPTD